MSMFYGVDVLAEYAPGWTPYRYGFNNPLGFIDPDGMFETRQEAKEHAQNKGIRTGIIGKHRIVEQEGQFIIENKKNGNFTLNDSEFGLMHGSTYAERGLHIRDIGVDAWNDKCNPFSELFNPDATLQMDFLDRIYLVGHQLGLALPSAKFATAAKGGKSAFEIAKSGGKHAGFYKNYIGRNADELNKAINTLQTGKRGINTHIDKIANPNKYVPSWNSLRSNHQKSLIKGWQKEIRNAEEQIQILRGILGN